MNGRTKQINGWAKGPNRRSTFDWLNPTSTLISVMSRMRGQSVLCWLWTNKTKDQRFSRWQSISCLTTTTMRQYDGFKTQDLDSSKLAIVDVVFIGQIGDWDDRRRHPRTCPQVLSRTGHEKIFAKKAVQLTSGQMLFRRIFLPEFGHNCVVNHVISFDERKSFLFFFRVDVFNPRRVNQESVVKNGQVITH